MAGHIEYRNGFPIWVDEETGLITTYTSITAKVSKDLPYYFSTNTTPIDCENTKNTK